MKKKYFYLILAMVLLFALCCSISAFAEDGKDAKQLLEHLYCPEGQEPVRDAVIESEKYMEVSESPYATSTKKIMVSQDKMFFLSPNKFRADILDTNPASALYGHSRTIIRDGKFVYTYVAYGVDFAKMEVDKPENTAYLPYYLQKYPIFSDFKYIYLGQEKINDQIYEVVGIFNPASYVDYKTNLVKVWIDAKKWVPYKIELTKYKDKEKKETYLRRTSYGDVKQLPDGRWWPFKITIDGFNKAKDRFIFESAVIYKKVAVNVGLEEDLFKPVKQ